MQKTFLVFLVAFVLACTQGFPARFKQQDVYDQASQMDGPDFQNLAKKTDVTIKAIITRAVSTLHDQGFDEEADRIEQEYKANFDWFVFRMVLARGEHHIGDHKPLIDWLAKVYDSLEAKLGVQVCKALHLSDIKTLNYCIPVVFHPCTFDLNGLNVDREAEYRRHFAMDDGGSADPEHSLYGLASVAVYWTIEGACLTGTSGIGSILCGLAATGAEFFSGHIVMPHISDSLFVRICQQ